MKINCIVQARMTSQRLPGKVLMDLAGRPMLSWTIERLRSAKTVGTVIVATSKERSDDVLVDYCRTERVPCHRGSLNNVAKRYSEVAEYFNLEEFIRVCGDSPLIDPVVVDRAVEIYLEKRCELVTNILHRTFPKGQSVEVVNAATFHQLCKIVTNKRDQESVTGAYYQSPEKYYIVEFVSELDFGSQQLSVDTHEDFEVIRQLIESCGRMPGGWKGLVKLKTDLGL